MKNTIVTGGLLEVYSVGPTDESVRLPIAALCNPGRGEEVSPINANPRLIELRWLEAFEEPLKRTFEEILPNEEADARRSPIMESIQSVTVTAFGGRTRPELRKRLTLMSDMLQHTDGVSHYKRFEDFNTFKLSPYYRKVHADLRGVEVELFYIRRQTRGGVQGAGHVRFWRDFVADQGGILVRVDSI